MIKKIFIIEDESIIAMSIKQLLTSNGFLVVGMAFDGDNILEEINNTDPELILVDIIINGKKTGIKIAKDIVQKSNKPIIFITGNSDEETYKEACKIKNYGYFTKPLNFNKFIKHLKSISLISN